MLSQEPQTAEFSVMKCIRQLAINKMLDQGVSGFEGGMTARKYISINKTTKSTATRDLQELADKNILCQKELVDLPLMIKIWSDFENYKDKLFGIRCQNRYLNLIFFL